MLQKYRRSQIKISAGNISEVLKRCRMALGRVKRTSSLGRKRVLILNHMEFDSVNDVGTPKKKQFLEESCGFCCEKSLLEAMPQEILIKILCGVDHDDLKRLFHVSKTIREAVVIAKK
ncbi:F-box protein SKIP27-like protein [Tanacetum coccineum]